MGKKSHKAHVRKTRHREKAFLQNKKAVRPHKRIAGRTGSIHRKKTKS